MASRFCVFSQPVLLNPEKTKLVTLACCILHNFLIDRKKNIYINKQQTKYREINGIVTDGE